MTAKELTLCAALLASLFSTTAAAAGHDPALRFRTRPTEHFIIYYHQGEDRLAERLAGIAEDTWRTLRTALHFAPPERTHVVLVDETELARGWATPVPRNTVLVAAAWPAGFEFIGNTDDWLRVVFAHEFTHILHLDRSMGWARALRAVFGRVPIVFPNLYLPDWQIEGLATYEESVLTGQGRLHAGDFQAILGEAARARQLEPLDRVNGGLTDWPGGHGPYAFGAGFHEYLADRFGAETLTLLAERTARRVPFTASPLFKRLYGESLGALWRDYADTVKSSTRGEVPPEGRRLTRHGFTVLGPRFAPACATCPRQVVYSVRSPGGFPTLNRLTLDGSAPVPLTTRYLGSTAAVGRRAVVFDQQELTRNVALYSDLYALDRDTRRVTRLTSNARLLDPDLSPDERTIAAVQQARGRRALVLVDATGFGRAVPPSRDASQPIGGPPKRAAGATAGQPDITKVISEAETQFNTPRWSPDGRFIAVERHRPGARSEIVIVDPALRSVHVVASYAAARVVTPAWRPDGRAIVAAADLNGEAFNLYEFSVDGSAPVRQLTHTTGGATWPDISSDGESIVFVGYTADGFDLFEMKYPEAPADDLRRGVVESVRPEMTPLRGASVENEAATVGSTSELAQNDGATYSPWPTLRPTWWSPVVEGSTSALRLGAATGVTDVLGYHAYSVSATRLLTWPARAIEPAGAALDWQIAYAYDRWRPTFLANASRVTSLSAGPATETGLASAASLRNRQVEFGVMIPARRVRTSTASTFSFLRAVEELTQADGDITKQHVASARGTWSIDSARTYGYSISREDGATFGTTVDFVRRAFGASGDATSVTVDGRLYLPSLAPHHVVALRIAAGTSRGDRSLGRTFHLGGASSNPGVVDVNRNAISLLRGFPADTFAGRHVALINAEYRWPIARPQRGHGTWPLFLHTVHAAVFTDAGRAWDRTLEARDLQSSVGAELSFDVVAGYSLPLTATIGAALGRDGSRTVANRATLYARVGRAF